MPTLAINNTVRNLRLQNRKLARMGQRYRTSPTIIHAFERPAAMAWHAVWFCFNRRGEI